MNRKILRGLLAAAILAAYPVASLYPFHPIRWEFPKRTTNGAEVLPQGGIRFAGPGVARSSTPPDWAVDVIRSHQLELSLRVRTLAPDQQGPARILTLSADKFRRNLTVGQEGEDLIVRLRTPATDLNGIVADGAPVARVSGVFRTARWLDLQVSIDPERLRVVVGADVAVDERLPAEPLRNWDPSFRLALGNELTNNRPWLGEIHRAAVYAGSTVVDYAEADVLELSPLHFWYTPRKFTLMPFGENDPLDAVINLVGYVPLGLVLGFWARREGRSRGWRLALPVLIALAVSASMETLQFGVGGRHPSTTDLILNTFGAGIGVVLAVWVQSAGPFRSSARTRLASGTAQTTTPRGVN